MNVKLCSHSLMIACFWLLPLSAATQVHAQAQQYPSKSVTIISDSAAGSTPDAVLRVIADRLSQSWGQQVLAVNHPGAAPNLPIQLPRDFTAIGFAAENPMFIVVTPSLGIKSLPDLIARAKGNPDEISCAVTGIGRLTHLTAELLQDRAGIKLLIVPYTGGPAHAISDVVSDRVGLIIEGYSGIAGAVQSGSVKAIAVASEKRLAEFPDLPTVAETIPGFSATGWQVLVAPIGTPEKIIRKVSEDLRKVVTDPDLK